MLPNKWMKKKQRSKLCKIIECKWSLPAFCLPAYSFWWLPTISLATDEIACLHIFSIWNNNNSKIKRICFLVCFFSRLLAKRKHFAFASSFVCINATRRHGWICGCSPVTHSTLAGPETKKNAGPFGGYREAGPHHTVGYMRLLHTFVWCIVEA